MSPGPSGRRPPVDAGRAVSIYREITDDLERDVRLADLVDAAAERHPDVLPTRAEIDDERTRLQRDKRGLEIDQGEFVAHVLADPVTGAHLLHAMSQPRQEALARLSELQMSGRVDLGPIRVERVGTTGFVVLQNHEVLNAEDDTTTAALETAVDLVLLDDSIDVGVLQGAPATHPKYAGRRVFGAGINLTQLYRGQISFLEFMIERELGAVSKMYRGHAVGPFGLGELTPRREKPWIAAVEAFAIGGACQFLLVMDRVVAEAGSYFSLPARNEGIIPGCANLRLPRLVGDRAARQAIFANRHFPADSAEGRLIADEVVAADEIDDAVGRAAADLMSAGPTALVANRRAMRAADEPLDAFRRYMSVYAREQAVCLYSPALIANLERNWTGRQRGVPA